MVSTFLRSEKHRKAVLDLEAFETATGRILNDEEREEFVDVQHQANRYTYIGSGMTHPKFLKALENLGPDQRERIEAVAPVFR